MSNLRADVISNKKLQLAIDLYSVSLFEFSENAQFITFVSVFEALAPDSTIPQCAQDALTSVKKAIKKIRDEHNKQSPEWSALEHLVSRVGNLKRQAIGTTLKTYISPIVKENPELGDPKDVTKRLDDIYGHRSNLLHKGFTDEGAVRESLDFLRTFVPKLLEHLYVSEANKE